MKIALLPEQATLVRYFLGELGGQEQEGVEERYMLDDAYAALRDEVELRLVDAYASDTLTAEERQHFESHYLVTRERREAVKAAFLSRVYRERIARTERMPVMARKPGSRWGLPRMGVIAALAALVLLGGLLFMRLAHRGKGAQVHNEAKSAPLPPNPVQPAPPPKAPPPAQLAVNHPPARGVSGNPPHPASVRPAMSGVRPAKHSAPAVDEATLPIAKAPAYPLIFPGTLPPASSATLVIGDINTEAVKGVAQKVFRQDVNISAGLSGLLAQRLREDGHISVETPNRSVPEEAADKNAYRLTADIATFGEREPPPPLSDDLIKKLGHLPSKEPRYRYLHATVRIAFRLTDIKTGEVIETGEVQGVSTGSIDLNRTPDEFAAMYAPGHENGSVDMTGSGFSQTLIGQATIDACDKLASVLKAKTEKQ